MQLKIGVLAVIVIAASGCATQNKSDKRVQALQLKLKKQHEALQSLKERNLVLEKRVVKKPQAEEIGESIGESIVQSEPAAVLPDSFTPSVAGATPVVTAPNLPAKLPAKQMTPPTPIAVSSEKTGEHFLYSKILETYRSKNATELERTKALLVKSYPESVFIDNAVYLNGLLAFENGDYKKAIGHFDHILKNYPRSNKAVAAIYAKASCEKRLGRVMDARRGYIQVRDLYPGSPEAARVSVELKLLEAASAKHRES